MIHFNHDVLIDLIQNKATIYQVKFGMIKLGATIDVIDIFEVNDIYVVNPLITSYNYENSNYTIRERFEKLYEFDGAIHLAGGLTCVIKNQKIEDFRISKRYIEKINHFTREEIISFHGKPDYELIDSLAWGYDVSVDNYILSYDNKKLNFYIDPEKNTLKEIYTARLDKSKFEVRRILL